MPKREFDLTIGDEGELEGLVQALNAAVRRQIMRLLCHSCYSIAELAKKLEMPISTMSFHVNVLRKAGLVSVAVKENSRGNAKIVSRRIDRFSLDFATNISSSGSERFSQEIPLGSFTDAKAEASCGMASEREIVICDDMPGAFFSPLRHDAQIIWLSKGYLEYRLPNYMLKDKQLHSVKFSMELCSEAPNYKNDWASDITFWINGTEVATYLSPGDYGGRRGRLNPEWWSDYSTQYGVMKTLKITPDCVCLDGTPVSAYTIEKLGLKEGDYIVFRIGVKEAAEHQGGLNLFGEKFGDFAQGLVYTVDYN